MLFLYISIYNILLKEGAINSILCFCVMISAFYMLSTGHRFVSRLYVLCDSCYLKYRLALLYFSTTVLKTLFIHISKDRLGSNPNDTLSDLLVVLVDVITM